MLRPTRKAFPLGSLAAAMFAAMGAASAHDPGAQTPRPVGTLSQTLRIAGSGAGAGLSVLTSTSDQVHRILPTSESPPHLITEGRRIKLPEGSPLRSELTVAVAAAKKIQRTLTLTGLVEAIPAVRCRCWRPFRGASSTSRSNSATVSHRTRS
jgi:hypothetical protein